MILYQVFKEVGCTVKLSDAYPPLGERTTEKRIGGFSLIGTQQHLVAVCNGDTVAMHRERSFNFSQFVEGF